MAVEILTKDDLQVFRQQLLNDIRQLFATTEGKAQKQWLKNSDVRKLLNVSSNTVQRLRIAGKLKSTKIGGIHYYRLDDIETLLRNGAREQF
jgi:hypothetical protein